MEEPASEGEQIYRTLSPLAIVGLVLGLASPVAFIAPVLLAVPVAALLISLLALSKIAANAEVLTGRSIAQAGIVLASICAAAVVTKGMVAERLLTTQAEPTARRWIELVVDGQVDASYQLTLTPARRAAGATPADDPEGPPRKDPREGYDTQPVIERLAALGEIKSIDVTDRGDVIWLPYQRSRCTLWLLVRGPDNQRERVTIWLERSAPQSAGPSSVGGQWRVAEAALSE